MISSNATSRAEPHATKEAALGRSCIETGITPRPWFAPGTFSLPLHVATLLKIYHCLYLSALPQPQCNFLDLH